MVTEPGRAFGLVESTYRTFRPPYPAYLYTRVFERLAGRARAVDLGAGTGLVTRVLAQHFESVAAVEPDPAMAAGLREDLPDTEFHACTAELAEFAPSSVDLITCANAFYWMDSPVVARRAATWLRPSGLFAAWRYDFPRPPPAVAGIFMRELQDHWLAFRDPRLDARNLTRDTLLATPGFESVDVEAIEDPIVLDAAGMVGFAASTSFGSAYIRSLPGDRVKPYLDGLHTAIVEALGGEAVPVTFELELVIAKARPD